MADNQLAGSTEEATSVADKFFNTSTEEPLAPTEEEAVESVEADDVENNSEEVEEAESNDDAEATEVESYYVDLDEQNNVTVQLDGKEYTKAELNEFRLGNMRDKDYRQKTQKVAEAKKQAEAEQAQNSANAQALESVWSDVESVISEWAPEELDRLKQKRDQVLASSKPDPSQKFASSLAEFAQTDPTWLDGGQATAQFNEVTSRMSKYVEGQGISAEELQTLSPRMLQVLNHASQLEGMKVKNDTFKAKAKKLPVQTKPARKAAKPAPKSRAAKFYS
jgi:hypothetical protein